MWVGGIRMSTIATSGLCIATCRSRSSALPACADDLEAGVLEQPRDALAQEDRVVGEDDAHRARRACAIVLRSGGKSRGRPSARSWWIRSGLGEPCSRCSPRSRSSYAGRAPRPSSRGEEDLAAVAGVRDPGGADARRGRRSPVAQRRRRRCGCRCARAARLVRPLLLASARCASSAAAPPPAAPRSGEELVAAAVDLVAAAPLDGVAQDEPA